MPKNHKACMRRETAKEMRKFKAGTLRRGKKGPGKGAVITDPTQAIAIALDVARRKCGVT